MAAEDGQQTGLDSLLPDPIGDGCGDFVKALAAGLGFEGVG